MSDVEEKIWDTFLLYEEIKKFPHTYETLLNGNTRKTIEIIARRKLNTMCSDGKICKTVIPGTRFGKVIFYIQDKKYYILIESDRIKNKVYCFFDYTQAEGMRIMLNKFWLLNKNVWDEHNEEKYIFCGNVLKLI
jgi:hypothetical protein